MQGPGFLMLANFRAIMKYNPAEAYALAIGHLADRLRGGEPFAQAWPRYERVLSRGERLELQQLLARHGYDVGEPDGHLGAKTRAAIRDFQRNGCPAVPPRAGGAAPDAEAPDVRPRCRAAWGRPRAGGCAEVTVRRSSS